jgi:hypothetical protein
MPRKFPKPETRRETVVVNVPGVGPLVRTEIKDDKGNVIYVAY